MPADPVSSNSRANFCETFKDGVFVVCRRYESMGIVLEKARNSGKQISSTPTRIEELPHSEHGRQAASNHVVERSLSAKHRIRVGKLNPAVGEFLAVENV